MENPIECLKENMWVEIEYKKGFGYSDEDIKEFVESYVRAINEIENVYYIEPKTKIENILNLKKQKF